MAAPMNGGLAALLVLAGAGVGLGASRLLDGEADRQAVLLRALEHQQAQLERLQAQLASAGPPGACAPATPGAGNDAELLRAELQRFLREWEARAPVAKAEPEEARAEPPSEPAPSPANLAAHERALRLLEEATARKRWGDGQKQELGLLLTGMTPAQQEQLKMKLTVMLNQGDIAVDVLGPPY